MKQISTEKFVEKLGVDVYPITIIKFLLNRRRILSYFNKAASSDFELRGYKYLVDNTDCEFCKTKKDNHTMCRQHTSINRVLNGEKVAYDVDTKSLFYKNEIFKKVDNRLVIIYCPHPKLIKIIGGEFTDKNVRKVNPITIDDPNLVMKEYKNITNFSSNDLLESYMKCWFNDDFSIISIPEDHNASGWCLVPNKKEEE
jgi:hypothetical protein